MKFDYFQKKKPIRWKTLSEKKSGYKKVVIGIIVSGLLLSTIVFSFFFFRLIPLPLTEQEEPTTLGFIYLDKLPANHYVVVQKLYRNVTENDLGKCPDFLAKLKDFVNTSQQSLILEYNTTEAKQFNCVMTLLDTILPASDVIAFNNTFIEIAIAVP